MKDLIFALKVADRGGLALYLVGSVVICVSAASDETWWIKLVRVAFMLSLLPTFARVDSHAYQALGLGYRRWRRDQAAVLMCGGTVAMVLSLPILVGLGESLWHLAIVPAVNALYVIRATRSRYESGNDRLWAKERETKRLDVRAGQQWRDSAFETSFMTRSWVGGALLATGALALAAADSVLCAWNGGLPGERLGDGFLTSIFFVSTVFYSGSAAATMRQTHRLWVQLGGERNYWVKRQGTWVLGLILGSLVGASLLWGYSLASVTSAEGEEATRATALVLVATAFAMIVLSWVNFWASTVVRWFTSVFIVAMAYIVSIAFVQKLGLGLPSAGIVLGWMLVATTIVLMAPRAVNRVDPFTETPIAGWLGMQKPTTIPA